VPLFVQQQDPVEQFVNVRAGLVNDDDNFAAVGDAPQLLDQRQRILRRQAAGRLVDDENVGVVDELHGDVGALGLTTRNVLDPRVFRFGHAKHVKVAGDALAGVIGRAGRVHRDLMEDADVFFDREFVNEHIALRHHSHPLADALQTVFGNVFAVKGDVALAIGNATEEALQQRGLASARGPHDGEYLAGIDFEIDVLGDVVAVFGWCLPAGEKILDAKMGEVRFTHYLKAFLWLESVCWRAADRPVHPAKQIQILLDCAFQMTLASG